MKIESLSIKSSTITIFGMIGLTGIVLSLIAGTYFKQAALHAQVNSMSRVIEVASQEMLKKMRDHTFDLGMKLGHSRELITAVNSVNTGDTDNSAELVNLLDDPFINGFVGAYEIDLARIRVYNMSLELIAQSSAGLQKLGPELNDYLSSAVKNRAARENLKAVDALWMSSQTPLFSTLVPLGGLRPVGYLEIVVNPVFNLPDIGEIIKTPVHFYSMSGKQLGSNRQNMPDSYLPVEFILNASNGTPAFKIIGYENVSGLNKEMNKTLVITISGFLLLSLLVLLFALWLFNRFLFSPVSRMVGDMERITHGDLELKVNKKGLREFHILAGAFNIMTEQVRMRTDDLQRLLDLDDNALMCFDHDKDAIYFNDGATRLFGYSRDEITDLDIDDLFADDIIKLLSSAGINAQHGKLHTTLHCKHKDGQVFQSHASITIVDVMGRSGFAIALGNMNENTSDTPVQSEQRLDAVEQTLSKLLSMARDNPVVARGLGNLGLADVDDPDASSQKALIREQVIKLMNQALACWEHDLGKTKLDLAEASKIWPVYMDKSTPTTRTLDKYLNIDTCQKNPRSQRASDTAEFVLRQADGDSRSCQDLQLALHTLRQLLSGV